VAHALTQLPAIVRLSEPIALTSIFPYAWELIKRFHVGDEQDASFYAGLLISSFSLAEALMGMYWGGLSDRIGRKPVLMIGCLGTMLSMIMVGFASNIWIALLGRAIGGLLNGNIGVIQTMVGELVTKPEHERELIHRYLHTNPSFGVVSRLTRLPQPEPLPSCPLSGALVPSLGLALAELLQTPIHLGPISFRRVACLSDSPICSRIFSALRYCS
jgi:MFS family permease